MSEPRITERESFNRAGRAYELFVPDAWLVNEPGLTWLRLKLSWWLVRLAWQNWRPALGAPHE